jgi:DNA-binding transcriptional ArsR family regulator/uncharacterized protein YndB with AHSA1/START domain
MGMDKVFRALADPNRRRLLDSLNGRNGQSLRELCVGLAMARQSVSKHLAVLEAANLVTTTWRGREKLHYLNAEPINAIADRWINQYDRPRIQTLADLKTALETRSMSDTTDFVYTTYIKTTPERLWQAITDPEQVILESDPYRRLAFTFHTFVPELSAAVPQLSAETVATAAAEQRSRVSFDIEPDGDQVKLTIIHGNFAPSSVIRPMVSGGWTHKLSNLKTALEAHRDDHEPAVSRS